MFEKEILDLFKVMLVDDSNKADMQYITQSKLNLDYVGKGFVTDFTPTKSQRKILEETYKPLNVTTLFSVKERENSDPIELIQKQILHYFEIYGLDIPGLFNLEVTKGKVVTMTYVRGVSLAELSEMIRKLLYTNAPVKDAVVLKDIIRHFKVAYNINEVKNNELRVILFDVKNDTYTSGDDVVRYVCWKATNSALLIKSPNVLRAVKMYSTADAFVDLLSKHVEPLARVFNRHKAIILSLKTKKNKSVINRISRLSKTLHMPIVEAFNKRFVSEALNGKIKDYSVLNKLSVRDKFKFLNLLEYKKQNNTDDAFIIRNGKVHLEKNRPTFSTKKIDLVIDEVIKSLALDFSGLDGKNILLDKDVDYGLPISRKQTVGNLPYGTTVTVKDGEISSGIYWENAGGARDLDLSAIDSRGARTGWGAYSGYDRKNPITFSGDVTDATNGAMEFMTSKTSLKQSYGLFVNIFAGNPNSKAFIVVGNKTEKKWIKETKIKEEHTLGGKGSIIGFVKNGKFVIYSGSMNNRMVSGSEKDAAIISRGLSDFWTVKSLFDVLGIKYDVDKKAKKVYDYSLSYSEMTYDKLEKLFSI